MSYVAPLSEIAFALEHVAALDRDIVRGLHGELTADTVDTIIEEAGRFASGVLAPLNAPADRIGAKLVDGKVELPDGWRQVYRDWSAAGWNGVDLPTDWGGLGLPTRVATACMEMWTSACMSFALGPVLTQGAAEAIDLHGCDALRETWLPKLVSGEWTATMNLTEPQAGSDLGLLRTRAEPTGDGSYRIAGNKIFITYGEHELTDNIVHLVLARLPDAPPGTRGISLFLVPKYLPDETGAQTIRNDVRCIGLERKLGIHASPTCAMVFGENDGAVGWLVGEAHRGLACMFTMMNKARLYTGLQGVAIAERAYQLALAYAKERRQGRVSSDAGEGAARIIEHPDVRRNLMTMKALIWAGRALAYTAAAAMDRAHAATSAAERARSAELAGLLTPVVKAYCSDIGVEVTSLGMQVHGGIGYAEEAGAAQLYRDARIAPIYEGTNGIQAIDLVTRKVLRPGSTIAMDTIAEYRSIADEAMGIGQLGRLGEICAEAVGALEEATQQLRDGARAQDERLASASPYLRLFAVAAGSALLTKGAIAAQRLLADGAEGSDLRDAVLVAHFYAENFAVMAPSLARIATSRGTGCVGIGLASDFAI